VTGVEISSLNSSKLYNEYLSVQSNLHLMQPPQRDRAVIAGHRQQCTHRLVGNVLQAAVPVVADDSEYLARSRPVQARPARHCVTERSHKSLSASCMVAMQLTSGRPTYLPFQPAVATIRPSLRTAIRLIPAAGSVIGVPSAS